MLHRIPAIEKIKAAIGWEPTFDLERILADVIRARASDLAGQASPVAEAVAAGRTE